MEVGVGVKYNTVSEGQEPRITKKEVHVTQAKVEHWLNEIRREPKMRTT